MSNFPTLSQIVDAMQDTPFTIDGEADTTVTADYYDHESDGEEYPVKDYPNGAMVLHFPNTEVEITRIDRMMLSGEIVLMTRHGTEYEIAFLMVNPNPFN